MTATSRRAGSRPAGSAARFRLGIFNLIRAYADFGTVLGACAIIYHVYARALPDRIPGQTPPSSGDYTRMAVAFGLIVLFMFWRLGLYRAHATVLNLWELKTAVKGVALAGAFSFALLFMLKLEGYSRFVIVGAIGLTAFVMILQRRTFSALVSRLQLRGLLGRRTLIYGSGKTGLLLMKKIVQAPHLGSTIVGFLDDSAAPGSAVYCRAAQTGREPFRAPVLGRLEDLDAVAREHRADELLVAEHSLGGTRLRETVDYCHRHGLRLGVVPHLGDIRADHVVVEDISAIPVLRPYALPSRRSFYLGAKRLFDLVTASVMLVLTAPLWALAAVLIRLDSPGPVFFVQDRVGLRGRRFRMWKFRTMSADADPYAPSPAGDVHPHITRIGRLLRIGGFDELPQILNVMRGDMSLVGPRPEMPFIVDRYTPLERQRLQVKPGITGLWQLSVDRHAEIHENLEYDLYYLHHQSLILDALILLETVFFTMGMILGRSGRRTLRAARALTRAVTSAWSPERASSVGRSSAPE
ncbi:MAG: sugar transferase [Gemmatimonadaceae bacterium]